MGKKGDNKTVNQERPISQQELRLLETQNQQLQKGIAVAENQEARSQEQHDIWKDNYLVDEVYGDHRPTPQMEMSQGQILDNQMPKYAEDTSGVMNQKAPNPSQQMQQATLSGRGGGKKGGQGNG